MKGSKFHDAGRVGNQEPGAGTELEETLPHIFFNHWPDSTVVHQMFCFFGKGSFHVLSCEFDQLNGSKPPNGHDVHVCAPPPV
jgi:hypothetical protein